MAGTTRVVPLARALKSGRVDISQMDCDLRVYDSMVVGNRKARTRMAHSRF